MTITGFNCLWCGRPHAPRSADDLEVFARLCPECVGRAQDNEFLRYRLREGLRARTAAQAHARADVEPAAAADADMNAYYSAFAEEYDDWYLRRGRYQHGPLTDVAFQADLDAATLWLDRLPIAGDIVELAAGTGWWSPLLAQKGELWLYDVNEQMLERARDRLLAHGLRAHIHVRDAWAPPERAVDAVFTGFWLIHVAPARLEQFFRLVREWLRPGGTYTFIEEQPQAGLDQPDEARASSGARARRRAGGREFLVSEWYHAPAALQDALSNAGFVDARVTTTSRFLVLGHGRVP